MLAALVFMLGLTGFALLVLGERMGLSPAFGAGGLALVLALCVAVPGLFSVTSRLDRYLAERGGVLATGLRGACVMLALLAFAPPGGALVMMPAGFALGFVLAHLAARLAAGGRAEALGRLLAGLAALVLALVLVPTWFEAARAALPHLAQAGLLAAGLALCVLLPGGARGIGALSRVAIALGLVLGLAPFATLAGLSFLDRADPLAAQTLQALWHAGLPAAASERSIALLLGAAAGLAGYGRERRGTPQALAGLVLSLGLAGVFTGVYLFGQAWLGAVIETRILARPAAQWPPFVFDEEIRGWLKACGAAVAGPLEAARACALASPAAALPAGGLTLAPAMTPEALARALGLPVLTGSLWALLPVLIGGAGLLTLLFGAATALSENLLHGLLHPRGLRSWRLAMARLGGLISVLLLALAPRAEASAHLVPALGVVLGLAVLALALARLRPPTPETSA